MRHENDTRALIVSAPLLSLYEETDFSAVRNRLVSGCKDVITKSTWFAFATHTGRRNEDDAVAHIDEDVLKMAEAMVQHILVMHPESGDSFVGLSRNWYYVGDVSVAEEFADKHSEDLMWESTEPSNSQDKTCDPDSLFDRATAAILFRYGHCSDVDRLFGMNGLMNWVALISAIRADFASEVKLKQLIEALDAIR